MRVYEKNRPRRKEDDAEAQSTQRYAEEAAVAPRSPVDSSRKRETGERGPSTASFGGLRVNPSTASFGGLRVNRRHERGLAEAGNFGYTMAADVVRTASRTAGSSGNWRLEIQGIRAGLSVAEGRSDLLTIRLARIGKKKQPSYRVVVIEKTRRRNGRFVEIVGHYDPLKPSQGVRLDAERIKHWLSCGAQPSETVRSFIRKEKIA